MYDFGMMGMMGMAAAGVIFFFWIITAAAFIFWLWALIDILKSEFTGINKLVWLVAVILLPLLGALLYWFIGREQKMPNEERKDTL